MKVLIVEDHPPMRELIRAVIADLAENVTECADGSEALAAYRQAQPDWVLMDIEMAGLDGISATRQIRAAYPEAHILIVTGHGDKPLREAAQAAGACGYVLKENLLELRHLLQTSS